MMSVPQGEECGFSLIAQMESFRATGVKGASGRRIDGAGHVAFQDETPGFRFGIDFGNCNQESLGVRVKRILKDILLVPQFHDPAEVHDRDSMADMPHH